MAFRFFLKIRTIAAFKHISAGKFKEVCQFRNAAKSIPEAASKRRGGMPERNKNRVSATNRHFRTNTGSRKGGNAIRGVIL